MRAYRPKAWREGPSVRGRASRGGEITYAEPSTRMNHVTAGMWCPSCGTAVRDDGLHSAGCNDVSPDRRRSA